MKTNAAVLWGIDEDWTIEEVDLDGPKDGEVLVEFAATRTLCYLGALILVGIQTDGTYRRRVKGRDVGTLAGAGSFSQYGTLSEASVVKIEDDLPLNRACLLGCGVMTGRRHDGRPQHPRGHPARPLIPLREQTQMSPKTGVSRGFCDCSREN
jgi:Zn-dependent alcohol dehydrogenase